jgi:ribonuclease BN (tRNA processing enzyme)
MKIKKISGKLRLSNDGGLSLFFIGSGSAFTKKNYQTNIVVIKGDAHFLIDCGATCPFAFEAYKSSLTEIKTFLITHSHADHIGGLEEAALVDRYITSKKPRMIIDDQFKSILWNYSLRGGLAHNEKQFYGFLEFEDFFEQIKPVEFYDKEYNISRVSFEGIDIKLFRTKHIPENSQTWKDSFYSIGVMIDERILYSGDTRFDPELIDFMLKKFPTIEYIFHDCQFFTGGVHAGYDELLAIDPLIRRKMFLCHYGDNYSSVRPQKDGFAGLVLQGRYYHFDK